MCFKRRPPPSDGCLCRSHHDITPREAYCEATWTHSPGKGGINSPLGGVRRWVAVSAGDWCEVSVVRAHVSYILRRVWVLIDVCEFDARRGASSGGIYVRQVRQGPWSWQGLLVWQSLLYLMAKPLSEYSPLSVGYLAVEYKAHCLSCYRDRRTPSPGNNNPSHPAPNHKEDAHTSDN